jgi:23S rRNA pseudouridine1911/1915/1917 synthase
MIKYQKIFENENCLVINKPAGLLVHGAEHINEPTLVDQLLKDYPHIAKVGEDPGRPGLMHRLDKLASGLLVVAKTQDSFDDLKKQFQARTIKKYYTALVYGKIDKDEARINFPIKRSAQGHKMAALPLMNKGIANVAGRKAVTEFSVVKRYVNYTLLCLKTKTGRTHQVRVHLSAYGHPIVGDDLYGTKKTIEKNKKLKIYRLFLVANELSFLDLNGELKTFKIPLPAEITNFLKQIKQSVIK